MNLITEKERRLAHTKYMREYRRRNSDRINASRRSCSPERKSELAAIQRQKRRDNPGVFKERARRSREKNGEKLRLKCREYHRRNKVRLSEYRKKWNKENRDLVRARKVNKIYGVSSDEYQKLVMSQNNLCAICKSQEIQRDKRTGLIRRLAVDHDHETGEVRGLLCARCNAGIGQFRDDRNVLRSAIEYLEFYENRIIKFPKLA